MMERVGDWDRTARLIASLNARLLKARKKSLTRFGLKAEGIAKKHMRDQDLPWAPLEPLTLARKIAKGYSENVLIASSTYFQSITSWVREDAILVGVKREVLADDGKTKLANIAAVHEFGSDSNSVPARPLWQPTLNETLEWHKKFNLPEKYFLEDISRNA